MSTTAWQSMTGIAVHSNTLVKCCYDVCAASAACVGNAVGTCCSHFPMQATGFITTTLAVVMCQIDAFSFVKNLSCVPCGSPKPVLCLQAVETRGSAKRHLLD